MVSFSVINKIKISLPELLEDMALVKILEFYAIVILTFENFWKKIKKITDDLAFQQLRLPRKKKIAHQKTLNEFRNLPSPELCYT